MPTTNRKTAKNLVAILALLLSHFSSATGQQANIEVLEMTIPTYPFNDPNPVPILTDNPKIYPYHKFEGYSMTPTPKKWTVVHLENEYIELWVLPEVGGKVWGAREKSTGEEFIYRNEVIKFRNIAMRGPWTSGGIEFNFGVIGHTPATATPVDYKMIKHEDGSVSCVVGTTDWPSRTNWRVDIRLQPDEAYFTTKALWYNPTGMHQAYYNWMTAAAFAQDDLVFYCPGDQYLQHSGEARPWPYEYNRHIASYQENDFLSSKSYHVVGVYDDFFGGYFENDQYGFGHWSLYDDMPGQKLWLWSLAPNGGIWEELLTDTDGQYIEFQAGRLFNQHFSEGHPNPITQASFTPQTADTWTEAWFPVIHIGGLTEVSPFGVLHVTNNGKEVEVGIQALRKSKGQVFIYQDGQVLFEEPLDLKPMDVEVKKVDINPEMPFEVVVETMDLHYRSHPEKSIKRPFTRTTTVDPHSTDQQYRQALELMDTRYFKDAHLQLEKVLTQDPFHLGALSAKGELQYRFAQYEEALTTIMQALEIDTYDPKANFVAGLIFKAQKDWVNAKEAFGWAARAMAYRSAAYALMAEIEGAIGNQQQALQYVNKSLDFNRLNLNAYKIGVWNAQKSNDLESAQEYLQALLKIDPLHPFGMHQEWLQSGNNQPFSNHLRNEFPQQSILELAIEYMHLGDQEMGISLLESIQEDPVAAIWLAYLHQDPTELKAAIAKPTAFVFPYRRETLAVLHWAKSNHSHWKIDYYLALNLWHKNQISAAQKLLLACGDQADEPHFYLTRANLQKDYKAQENDLLKAQSLAPQNWRVHHQLHQFYLQNGKLDKALTNSRQAFQHAPNNYTLGMDHVAILLQKHQFAEALNVLEQLTVLPFEGASAARKLYEQAHYGRALALMKSSKWDEAIAVLEHSLKWPHRLGVGKPFHPDERMAHYLLAKIYDRIGNKQAAQAAKKVVKAYTLKHPDQNLLNELLGLELMDADQLTDLMVRVYDDQKQHPPLKQWVLAMAGQQKDRARQLETNHPELFRTLSYWLNENARAF